MDDQVYFALETVRAGKAAWLAGRERWLEAMMAAGWLNETTEGFSLTEAGGQALAEMGKRFAHSITMQSAGGMVEAA